jgi:hypothetical protein
MSSGMWSYRAYGLSVNANRSLPWFQRARPVAEPDVVVHFRTLPLGVLPGSFYARKPCFISSAEIPPGEPWLKGWHDPGIGYFCFRWSDGTVFIIEQGGKEVWADWPKSVSQTQVTTVYFPGNMMSFILRLRGYVCLHASALLVDGETLLIAGQQGAGKSTLAAAFANRGFPVLADDVAALRPHRGKMMAYPSFPRIGLWPTSVEGLFGPAVDLPRISADEEKRYLALGHGKSRFWPRPAPLGAVYFLSDILPEGDVPRVEPADGPNSVLTLAAVTYGILRHENEARAAEFRLLFLAAQKLVRRVHRPADLSRVGELREAILEDFRSLRRGRTPPGERSRPVGARRSGVVVG